jgi:septal ring factor EnvC (AmiA/AmiB activator)
LLSQKDPYLVARNFRYNDYFLQARTKKIKEYESTVAHIKHVEQGLQETLNDLHEQYRVLAKQQNLLLKQRAERARTLRALRGQIKNKGDTLKQLIRDKAQLAKVIAAARSTVSRLPAPKDYQAFSELKGRLAWPIKGRPQNNFGALRSGSLKWDGLMISAQSATPVSVIHSGRVVFADWLSGFGLLMIVDHGGGYMSLYAHNEVLLKAVGEWVRSGDIITRSGDTGAEQSSGLYFEIRYQGNPIDPARWCK